MNFLWNEGCQARAMLQAVIEETLEKYSCMKYRHDPRILEIYLLKEEIGRRQPKKLMRALYSRGQFRFRAELYILWAMIYGKQKCGVRVMEIYRLGYQYDAQPTDLFVYGFWNIAEEVFGKIQAYQYGFLSGKQISKSVITLVKNNSSKTPTQVTNDASNELSSTEPLQELSAEAIQPPQMPKFSRSYLRMIKYITKLLPIPVEKISSSVGQKLLDDSEKRVILGTLKCDGKSKEKIGIATVCKKRSLENAFNIRYE
ncbi:unnamed protein product [Thelazia callipaeda]|uniref:BUB1 N-terminal domain-containing protein n=1 Tax=Thelazia callipaeda TaxID=103827 RepID=A0A0N5D481_THECL|nr:unnamed protein product [Thelazia callipaeda]